MKITVIGGTGPQGSGLAQRFALAGLDVIVGSRDGARAESIAAELMDPLEGAPGSIVGMDNLSAVQAADEMVDSRWYTQVPNRARRLVDRMRALHTEE